MSGFPPAQIIPPQVLLGAYAQGVFPMADQGELTWFSPLMRGVIPLDDKFHIPHGLKRVMKKPPFTVKWDSDFRGTMQGCAARERTWIDVTILESYCLLHRLGYAHSVEVHDAEGLQGGLYGVALGRAFFGESMFSRKTDASKIALVALVRELQARDFLLLDTQWLTEHLRRFGGQEIPRDEYQRRLKVALGEMASSFHPPALGPAAG
ncbi:leucyl/phenylalanyl-tRNA--protein transferase [Haloferula sp. BvORR071]|uniref:leucyl/phenylalanyl-tRNA--protein transferase n=1 Tax=Haloferula sp. BvORR071 TaxID=1396141 RepID=UPI00055827CE|nr:leucyl/phenylalanyl-tRNA--protein transferase [Haloferula sp. BvORR071]